MTLVWSQWFDDLREAHARERQLKGWSRAKKCALVAGETQTLKFLASRRAGKSKLQPKPRRREMVNMLQSIGAANPEALFIGLRHPEARAAQRRAPKGDE